jgi:hypothetical protein
MPKCRPNSRLDQCVTASVAGGGSNVAAMIAASSMVFGRPGRGSSSSPASPCARNRSRHLITVGRVEPTAAATELVPAPGCAHASTIRARSTYPARIDLERDHDLNVKRSCSESTSGAGCNGAMHPSSRPPDCKATNDAQPLEAIRAAT